MAMSKAEQERLWRLMQGRDEAQSKQRAAESKRDDAIAVADAAVARAANLRWHAVYGAAVVAGMRMRSADWWLLSSDADMATCVARARAIADQSERLFPVAKGGDDGEA